MVTKSVEGVKRGSGRSLEMGCELHASTETKMNGNGEVPGCGVIGIFAAQEN